MLGHKLDLGKFIFELKILGLLHQRSGGHTKGKYTEVLGGSLERGFHTLK